MSLYMGKKDLVDVIKLSVLRWSLTCRLYARGGGKFELNAGGEHSVTTVAESRAMGTQAE